MSNEDYWDEKSATAEREQCCKDICNYCSDGYPIECIPDGTWVHSFSPIAHVQCKANRIRERAWKESEDPKFADNPADKT